MSVVELRENVRDRLIAGKKWRQDTSRKLVFRLSHFRSNAKAPGPVGFVIAGAQKSGTTALYEYLREHPGVAMAEKKELHFFDEERHFRKAPDYLLYHSYFDWNSKAACFGEATPNYMYSSVAVERIHRYNPQMKLILILRNPIERAFSQWNMHRDRGYGAADFLHAIAPELRAIADADPNFPAAPNYLRRGFYSMQIQRLWSLFPRKNVLVLRYESLRKNRIETLSEVAQFLEIPAFPVSQPREVHARPYARPMDTEERKVLEDLYAAEIRTLETMLDWDCSNWHSQNAG